MDVGRTETAIWLERILNDKYPTWRRVEYNGDGSARYMPVGLLVVEASLLRRYHRTTSSAVIPRIWTSSSARAPETCYFPSRITAPTANRCINPMTSGLPICTSYCPRIPTRGLTMTVTPPPGCRTPVVWLYEYADRA